MKKSGIREVNSVEDFSNVYKVFGEKPYEEKYTEDSSTFVIDLREESGIDYVQFEYIEEGDVLKGVILSGDFAPSLYSEEIQISMQAFIYAKEPKSAMTSKVQKVYDGIMEMYDTESRSFEVYGVEVTNTNKGDVFELEMKIVE